MKRLFSLTLAMILTCSMLMIGASAATGNSKTFTMENGDSFTISNYVAEVTEEVQFREMGSGTDSARTVNYYIVNQNSTITFHVNGEDVEGTIRSYDISGTAYYPSGEDGTTLNIGNSSYADCNWDVTLKASDFVSAKHPLASIYILLRGSEPIQADGGIMSLVTIVDRADAYIKYDDGTAPKSITATPTASKVLVNGKEISFDAYTINQNNYFKLRDIASVLSGTNKQFEVTWNSEKGAIDMLSNQAYTPVGGELAAGDGLSKTPVLNTAKVYLDGQEVNLTAYTINGNNYFKLRDLGKLFDFDVSWNGAVVIDTSKGNAETETPIDFDSGDWIM